MGQTPHVSLGVSNFADLRRPGVLLVDKTDLIARVLSDPYQTLLFPRPRRFGKTTNLSMIGYFLGQSDTDHSALFQDLAVGGGPDALSALPADLPDAQGREVRELARVPGDHHQAVRCAL